MKCIIRCALNIVLVWSMLLQPAILQASTSERDPVFSQKDLLQDLEIFITTLRELHGNVFHSIDQERYDELYIQAKNTITKKDSMTIYDFYRTLLPVITAVKCGHTNIFLENDYDYKVFGMLKLRICDSIAYIATNDFGLPEHVEIVAVNQYSVMNIIQAITEIIPADADNIQYKTHKIEDHLLYYYNIVNNNKDKTYKIKYIDQNGNIKIAVVTDQPDNTELNENYNLPFQYTSIKGTALLKFRSFYTPDFKNQGFSPGKTIRNLFQQIQNESIDTLIIDIRDNEGGSVVLASYIFSFLTDRNYKFYKTMVLSPVSDFTCPEYIFKDPFVRFKRILTKKRNNKRIYNHKLTHESKPSNKNNFKGSLIAVTNGSTFSAASIFASMLKSECEALILGEETGGSYNKNGIYQVGFYLPNSQLKVVCPFTFAYLNVKETDKSETGLIPDITIDSCILDYLISIDSFQEYLQ